MLPETLVQMGLLFKKHWLMGWIESAKLVAHLSRILADQDQDPVMTHDELLDHYEHRLLDVIESQGSDGLLRSLFAAQENS